jgi:hypothetical protein
VIAAAAFFLIRLDVDAWPAQKKKTPARHFVSLAFADQLNLVPRRFEPLIGFPKVYLGPVASTAPSLGQRHARYSSPFE